MLKMRSFETSKRNASRRGGCGIVSERCVRGKVGYFTPKDAKI